MHKIVGKIAALENRPTTIDDFYFWTDQNRILAPFDVIAVTHLDESVTFGVVQEINHITDTPGYMGTYISNDFGDLDAKFLTNPIGMNYVKAQVLINTKNIYTPVQHGSAVRLATAQEIRDALGLLDDHKGFPLGYIEMYAYDESEKVRIAVYVDRKFLIGPEGAHLNISGISGLAAKTSYNMFIIKGMQHKMLNVPDDSQEQSIAFVVMNVKGRDLLTLDQSPNQNEFTDLDTDLYKDLLGINPEPFENVRYYYPYSGTQGYSNTYASNRSVNDQIAEGKAFKYKYTYEDDRENLDLLFANVDDPNSTMESICNVIQTGQGNFGTIRDWSSFRREVEDHCQSGIQRAQNEITVQSWRKFKRLINNPLHNPIFANRVQENAQEARLRDSLSQIKANEIHVVDIAKLDEMLQSFVFGDVIRTIHDLKLGQILDVNEELIPKKIIIFIDELNKYAGIDVPKNSPILRNILDITERGRSLGIVLFSAEQFKSAIHDRVKGNCATHAYGRTNAIELSKKDYSFIPSVYKNMMTRLRQGEYIVQNPIFSSPLNIKFPRPVYHQEK